MFLVVGLGNPGLRYSYTRHNVGFMFVDYLSYSFGFPDYRSKFDSLYSEKMLKNGKKAFIQKPQTFMNLSGQAVSQIVAFFKILPEKIFIFHDDLDLPLFNVKIKFAGGNGGHNGLKDIDKAIGNNYWRIRVGIGRPLLKDQVTDYVLSVFRKDELSSIASQVFEPICENFEELLFSDEKTSIINKIFEDTKR
ncbi:MAG: aminoacyl-tRNA hydrolase [Holosporales bacterium]|jgi:PTH1 family peptidyl-tRNA hydrolase|nr:aminoacyl-tRNA hydrolase [Holosporales bacterium]